MLSLHRSALPLRRPFQRFLTTIGIRREDPARIWERRVPLTPDAVSSLVRASKEVKVEVESCKRRCFPDQSYQNVGAQIVPRLSHGVDLVLGIKEPPVAEVQALVEAGRGKKRTWMVFSHTHKGQVYNTSLLSSFLDKDKSQTLIDHELLAAPSEKGALKRVAAFGWYAGAVGAGEALSMTGLALLKRGIASPLLHLPRPYTFASVDQYKAGLSSVGDEIRRSPPSQDGPVIIGLTGSGNVSQGAKAMLDAMGVEWLLPEQLKEAAARPDNKVYACAVPPAAYFANQEGKYSRETYYAEPQSYTSSFAEKIAPYLTTLINGQGWTSSFPKIITEKDMATMLENAPFGRTKLAAIQDVTCDLKGNLEFIDRHTTIDNPHFEGPGGILISTIDILPTELATDASEHFSGCILPYVRHFTDPSSSDSGIVESLERASIVRSGALTQSHRWLQPRVDELRVSESGSFAKRSVQKKVLLLGSGLVAGPAVEVFAARPDVHLVIASNNFLEAQGHLRDCSNVEAIYLDVSDSSAVNAAVAKADVVVSLLPAPMHVPIAKHCLEHGRHLVTASYVSPEMKALHAEAQEKDVLLLGECGLDPGIDSMAAMRILDRVKREGKKVKSFVSWCGGLPEPAASNVPLGYKFSWSPKAVLTAAKNDARYKLDGKVKEIPGDRLLAEHFSDVQLWKGLSLEGLANRDSIPYAEKYGLGAVDGLKDLFRGTLRYKGFSQQLEAFRRLGLLETDPLVTPPTSWSDVLPGSIARAFGTRTSQNVSQLEPLIKDILSDLDPSQVNETIEALKWLSLIPGHSSTAPLPQFANPTTIDYFAALLSHKLAYLPHERDSALLHHSFELSSGEHDETGQTVTASLLTYGTESASAMSVTVGKTLAFAALRVLDGQVSGRGVTGPYEREVWEGVLQSLEDVGVRVEEKWS